MSKRTLGLWEVTSFMQGGEHGRKVWQVVTPNIEDVICEIEAGDNAPDIARLIAEVPAMVEALRRILQWIDAGCDPSRKSLENARAILSRIEGKA